jgi:site-specific DNA-methyltransferase (adenine-specific)
MRNNIPDNFVDLTVTSPPYDNLRTYKGFTFDYKSMLQELYRITKDGGIVVWIVNDAVKNNSETLTSFKQAIYAKEECGFNVHDTMFYQKNSYPFPMSNRYYQQIEYMFVFSKGKPKTANLLRCEAKGRKRSSTTRNPDGTTKDKIAYKHPAQFPENLARDHILSWSNEGDIVFDPMCGAGTTCKEAYLLHRNFIGVDMSEEYINTICIPRLEQYGWNNI